MVKFIKVGLVIIRLSFVVVSDELEYIVIEVIDIGIGMSRVM